MQRTTVLRIEGMSCENCQRHAQEALCQVPGVVNASVCLKTGKAIVDHMDSVTVEQLVHAVEEEGYKAFPAK